MSLKTKHFSIFGVDYRSTQLSAMRAMELMSMDDISPIYLLEKTESWYNGNWVSLGSAEGINAAVHDCAKMMPPSLALDAVVVVVQEFNFGFLDEWKSVKIPSRFRGGESVESTNINPIASQLVQDSVATLKELETYYSLEDAFKLFDVISSKILNQCLANEAAMKK